MLEGLQRLLTNGYFTESKSQEETEIAFERASETISAFLNEIAVFDKNLVTTRSQAFDSYKNYCDMFGLEAETDKKFTQRLKETPKISVTVVTKPKQERAWKGLGLKTLNDDGTITGYTHFTHYDVFYPQTNVENSSNNKEGGQRVKSVKCVKNCGHCANFRMPSCESKDNWENRSGNIQPMTNYCFKPKTELEE